MEPSDHAKACHARADEIIKRLLVFAERGYAEHRPGQTLPEAAKTWWTMHYLSKFFYALDYKGNDYETDRADLEKKATELGRALAASSAGQPTREDAARASFLVDCPEAVPGEEYGALMKWCN